jgi:hypothetical protein
VLERSASRRLACGGPSVAVDTSVAHYGRRVHLERRAVIGVLCLVLLASGCSARSIDPGTTSSSSASASSVPSAPSGTVSMATLGWKNGPAARVFLPNSATIDRRVDQANVITAIGRPEMAATVLSTLTETLPTYGWTITAGHGGSLVFSDASYDGAFTSDASVWALTIRVKA